MKRYIKDIFKTLVVALPLVAVVSCSDWTQTESLEIKEKPTLEEQNPALWAQYCEALKEYKASEHKLTFITVANSDKAPNHSTEHLTAMPDSVDYIRIASPAVTHPELAAEFKEVAKKGTKVIYTVSYDDIASQWRVLIDEGGVDLTPREGESELTEAQILEARFMEYLKEQTSMQIEYAAMYGYDGVEMGYNGVAPASLNEEQLALTKIRQDAFIAIFDAWKSVDSKQLLFKGHPQNLIDAAILQKCQFITLSTASSTSMDNLTVETLAAAVEGVPSDRFIVEVSMPNFDDPTSSVGYFSGVDPDDASQKFFALKGAAMWVNEAPIGNYTKAGISLVDAQKDYYGYTVTFARIREAIYIMNPSPKN